MQVLVVTPPIFDEVNPPLQHSLEHMNVFGGSLQRWPAGMQHVLPLQPLLSQSLADAHASPSGDLQPVKKLQVPLPPAGLMHGWPAHAAKGPQIPFVGSLQFRQSAQQTNAQQENETQSSPVRHALPPNCRVPQVCVVPRQTPEQQSAASAHDTPLSRQAAAQTPVTSSHTPEQQSTFSTQRVPVPRQPLAQTPV